MYKILFSIAAGLILTGLAGCGHSDAETAKAVPPSETGIDVVTIGRDTLASRLQIPGELVSYQQVDLYAKVNSFVKSLQVDVGSAVHKGQLLAVLEAPELGAQLAGAQSRLKAQEAVYLSSKATYDRLLETSKTPGTISQNDMDQAYARMQSGKAELEAARAAIAEVQHTRDYLEIRAPFAGVITSRNVSTGAYVGPSGKGSALPVFTLAEQQHLRLVVSVPEQYTSYIQSKSEVTFTVHSIPGRIFRARISRLAGALDNNLRAQRTEMDVVTEDGILLPGMVTEVSFPVRSLTGAQVVPTSAVLHSTQGVFVIKSAGHKAVWVPVTEGRSDDTRTEVFGAVKTGDTLVKQASEEVREGQNL